MKNQIVTGLWIGDTLPELARLCIASFIHHGHTFQLYTYQDYDNVPDGTIVKNANDLIDSNCLFLSGAFNDWFRWVYLSKHGGWFIDMDVVCMSDDLPDADIWMGHDTLDTIGTYLIKFPADHPGINELAAGAGDPCSIFPWTSTDERSYKTWLLHDKRNIMHRRHRHIDWAQYGKHELMRMVRHYKLDRLVAPADYVNPLSWESAHLYFNGNLSITSPALSSAFALHLYYWTVRQNGGKIINNAAENSVYKYLLNTYLK